MDTDQRFFARVVVSLLCFAGSFVWFLASREGPLLISTLAIFATGLLAIRLHRVVQQGLNPATASTKRRVLVVASFVGLGVALLVTRSVLGNHSGLGLLGVALMYLGVGIGLEQLRRLDQLPKLPVFGLFVVLVVVLEGGLIAAALGAGPALLVALIALGLMPTAISLLSELTLRGLASFNAAKSVVLAIGGAALLAAGLIVVGQVGLSAGYVWALSAAVLVLMVAIAARSNIDVVLVIAAAAVVWTLGTRVVPEPDALKPSDEGQVFVALGDSFMSGEGAEVFFEGTNTPGESQCRRAPTAYAVLLVNERRDDIPEHVRFLACSGAKTEEIDEQLELVREIGKTDRVEFVLLSIGGNDALFGTIGRVCLLPVDCSKLGPAWLENMSYVTSQLEKAYGQVEEAFKTESIYVMPYPIPIAPAAKCGYSPFTRKEREFLYRFTSTLDDTIAASAADANFEVVDTVPAALVGMRLCDGPAGDAGVNFLASNSVFGSLEQSVNPLNWIHNSLHPNARGHEALRASFVAWLDDVEASPLPAPSAPANPESWPCRGKTGNDLDGCSWDWAKRETSKFLLARGWLMVFAIGGAWLLALQLIRGWRWLFGAP